MSSLLKCSCASNIQMLLSHPQSTGRASLPQTSPGLLWERLDFLAVVGVKCLL